MFILIKNPSWLCVSVKFLKVVNLSGYGNRHYETKHNNRVFGKKKTIAVHLLNMRIINKHISPIHEMLILGCYEQLTCFHYNI